MDRYPMTITHNTEVTVTATVKLVNEGQRKKLFVIRDAQDLCDEKRHYRGGGIKQRKKLI